VPGPWENVASGSGWRLVAHGQTDVVNAYSVRAGWDATSWVKLWTAAKLGEPSPDVDLSQELVVSFGEGLGSNCREIRLDAVAIDLSARLVYPNASDPLAPRACLMDLSAAHVFVIAVDRSALPDSPFTVQLQPPGPCDACASQAKVTVNLP
jgi:hypothetical protein